MTNDDSRREPTPEEREALLVEYQVCQQDSDAMIRTHWTVAGIFIGINTALVGAVAYMLNSSNSSSGTHTQWIVLALGLALAGVFVCLWLWLDRVNRNVGANECVMRRIERCLHLPTREKPPGDGSWPVKGVYAIFIALWVAAIVGACTFDC